MADSFSLLGTLLARPAHAPTRASRFVMWNGAFYLGFGALAFVWPGMAQTLFGEAPFVGKEAALLRLVGMVLAIVGWFYVMGGRAGGSSFAAATVVDRLVVPVLLGALVVSEGLLPRMLTTFAVLDPLLGLAVWWLLSAEKLRPIS